MHATSKDDSNGALVKLAYRSPTLIAYGSIADFTAGGSGVTQESSKCNGPNKMKINKC